MFDSCICVDIDGGEDGDFSARKLVTARKEHKCCECRQSILRGQKHELLTGKWDGRFASYRTCLLCKRIRDDLFVCGYHIGDIWDAIHEAYCGYDEEDEECICP
jgi:hypothetical protein